MIFYPNIIRVVNMNDSYPEILKKVKEQGYTVFERGAYNLNIIGVRSPSRQANAFDDFLYVVYKDDFNNWIQLRFSITTDAGLYHLNNPSKVEGTAILVAGQYRGVYKIDLHRGQYKALCQRGGAVKVYRDNNRDTVLDQDAESIETGYFGINIHRANSKKESTQVDKWSAGCQVFADPYDYDIFISICEKAETLWGNSFSYTLLEE